MEQGKIDKLLSSKPEDRRAVFEEAAGITKFKVEKKEALRKLEYTEANLLRHADILEELKRQMNSLNRQAGKARRYQALLKDVRVLDSHYSYRQFTNLSAEKSELETSIRSLSSEQGELGQTIGEKESGIVSARDALQQLESEIAQQREQVIDKQNRTQSAKNRIGFNEERVRELSGLIEQNTADIDQTRGRLAESEDEFKATSESLNNIESNLQRQRGQLEEHQQRAETVRQQRVEIASQLARIGEEVSGFESRLHSTDARLASSQGQLENDNQRNGELARELTALDETRDEKSQEHHSLKEELHHRHNELEEQQLQLGNIEREHQQAQNDHEQLRGELSAKHREYAERSSRLEVLQQLVADGEGLQGGTQAVLKGLDNPEFFHPAVRGLLSSFIEVDSEFIPAIETALGRHLQTILVTDSDIAESMIATLTARENGRGQHRPRAVHPGRRRLTDDDRPRRRSRMGTGQDPRRSARQTADRAPAQQGADRPRPRNGDAAARRASGGRRSPPSTVPSSARRGSSKAVRQAKATRSCNARTRSASWSNYPSDSATSSPRYNRASTR